MHRLLFLVQDYKAETKSWGEVLISIVFYVFRHDSKGKYSWLPKALRTQGLTGKMTACFVYAGKVYICLSLVDAAKTFVLN